MGDGVQGSFQATESDIHNQRAQSLGATQPE